MHYAESWRGVVLLVLGVVLVAAVATPNVASLMTWPVSDMKPRVRPP